MFNRKQNSNSDNQATDFQASKSKKQNVSSGVQSGDFINKKNTDSLANINPVEINNNTKNHTKQNQISDDYYVNLNKLPTDPSLSLISQSSDFVPIKKEQIVVPSKISPAEAIYLSESEIPVIKEDERILAPMSNIYSLLQQQAEQSEAMALSGAQIAQYHIKSESPEEENIFSNSFIVVFNIISILVLIFPAIGYESQLIRMFFMPSLLFMIVCFLLTASSRVNPYLTVITLAVFIIQSVIGVIAILKLLEYISGDVIIFGSYLQNFYL